MVKRICKVLLAISLFFPAIMLFCVWVIIIGLYGLFIYIATGKDFFDKMDELLAFPINKLEKLVK